MKKRLLSLLCILLCLCLFFSGCSSSEASSSSAVITDTPAASPTDFVLPFTESDGYNPYLHNTNITLKTASLLFESMIVITPDLDIAYQVVTSCKQSGTELKLHCAADKIFADGTPITADDVAASLNAARTSQSFQGRFSHIEKVEVVDRQTVSVSLKQPDSLFIYLLDIPVLKASEVAAEQPTASGRYTYGEENTLIQNPYYDGVLPFPRLVRRRISGYDALISNLSLGNISVLSSELETEIMGAGNLRQNYFRMNSLLFIGINGSTYPDASLQADAPSAFLKLPAGRRALSKAIDRQLLVEKAYYSRGYAATGLCNPAYPGMLEHQTEISSAAQPEDAQKEIEGMGYKKELDGYYYSQQGERLSLRLLYYGGSSHKRYLAEMLQNQLKAAGIELVLVSADDFEEDYKQKISFGDFDLYIGEVKLYNDMDMSTFFYEEGALHGKLSISPLLLSQYEAFRADLSAAQPLEHQFASEMPFIPLLWRSGVVYSDKQFPNLTPSISDIFYGFEKLTPQKE